MLQWMIKKNTQKMCQEARKIVPPGSQRTRQVRRRRRWPRGQGMCSTFSPDFSGEPHLPLFMTLVNGFLTNGYCDFYSYGRHQPPRPDPIGHCGRGNADNALDLKYQSGDPSIVMEWQVWSYQVAKGSEKPIEGKAEPEGELCIAICRATCLPAKPPKAHSMTDWSKMCLILSQKERV